MMTNLSSNLLILKGINTLNTLIDIKKELITKVYLVENSKNHRIKNIKKKLIEHDINFEELDRQSLNLKSSYEKNQGVLTFIKKQSFLGFKEFKYFLERDSDNNLILILDSITDPRNMGSCLRSAHASGVDAVLINQNGSAKINEYVYEASVGSIFNLKIFIVPNLTNCINLLKNNNFWITGLDLDSSQSLYEIDFNDKVALVLGSEHEGISKIVYSSCDYIAQIPMKTNIDSLNVSVAAGIALFEINRQRNKLTN